VSKLITPTTRGGTDTYTHTHTERERGRERERERYFYTLFELPGEIVSEQDE